MPPLAVPSSLVSTMPVTSTASANCFACTRPFCPVDASITSSTSLHAPGVRSTMRRSFFSSSIRFAFVCSRPAVSTSTRSALAARRPRTSRRRRPNRDRRRPGRADDLAAGPVGPELELIGRGGAERVGRREHDALAVRDLLRGELADRRGLPDAVDADEHPHVQLVARQMQACGRSRRRAAKRLRRARARSRPSGSVAAVSFARVRTASSSCVVVVMPTSAKSSASSSSSHVSVVDLAAAHAAERAGERAPRATEPVAQTRLFDDFGLDHFGLDDVGRRRLRLDDDRSLGWCFELRFEQLLELFDRRGRDLVLARPLPRRRRARPAAVRPGRSDAPSYGRGARAQRRRRSAR